MGLYDFYQPNTIACPKCKAELEGWQGKDGPCALFLWREGAAHPIDQPIDVGARIDRKRFIDFTLPARFSLYAECGNCTRRFDALGFCDDSNVWVQTRLGPDGVDTAGATEIGDGWRMCTGCTEAWQWPTSAPWALCPRCHQMTRTDPT